MQRRDLLQGLLATGVAAGAGCSRRHASGPPRQLEVAASRYLVMAPLYLAYERGYFAQAGLELAIRHFASAAQALPLLAAGKLDVSFSALSPALLNAVAKGSTIRIVAGREVASPVCGEVGVIYGRREAFPRGIEDLRHLRGKRLAAGAMASVAGFLVDTLLAQAGLRETDLELLYMDRSNAVAALTAGKIDAMLSGLHPEKDLVATLPQLVRSTAVAQALAGFQYSHILFGESLLKAEPAAGARFLAAYLRGVREYRAGATPRFQEEYIRENKLDPRAVQVTCRETSTPDGSIDLGSLRRFLEWAIGKGYSQPGLRAEQLVDHRFLELARRLDSPKRS
jgi:NitT/TauT family transport system substrate-binding protein